MKDFVLVSGLDISAYKNLCEVEKPVLDEEGYPKDWMHQWKPGAGMEWSESIWPGKGFPVTPNSVYEYEEVYSFHAGSYSSYSWWKSKLSEFKGERAFQELFDFADTEGVIGAKLSAKLRDDFNKYHEEAVIFANTIEDGGVFIEKYVKWQKAFQIAPENGAVEFH